MVTTPQLLNSFVPRFVCDANFQFLNFGQIIDLNFDATWYWNCNLDFNFHG